MFSYSYGLIYTQQTLLPAVRNTYESLKLIYIYVSFLLYLNGSKIHYIFTYQYVYKYLREYLQ